MNDFQGWFFPYQKFGDSFSEHDLTKWGQRLEAALNDQKFRSVKAVLACISEICRTPGCVLVTVFSASTLDADGLDLDNFEIPGTELDLETMASLGIIRRQEASFEVQIRSEVDEFIIVLYHMTMLGARFVEACDREAIKALKDFQDSDVVRSAASVDKARRRRIAKSNILISS